MRSVAVLLIGDSDINRWPEDLHPDAVYHFNTGKSGATLEQCIVQIPDGLRRCLSGEDWSRVFVVACAGENDISSSISIEESCDAMKRFLVAIFATDQDRLHLIFLGPKLEPWLNDDKETRRHYIRMSRAFEKICSEHALSDQINFIDCLLMFCGESANQKGALLGGKAKAETKYFDYDLLHLNQTGYRIWKGVVDSCIESVMTQHEED